VLRHSLASLVGDLGYSEPTIATLIGHKGHSVTARYIHAADAVLLAAADALAKRTAELMGEAKPDAKVVPLPPRSCSCLGALRQQAGRQLNRIWRTHRCWPLAQPAS
jgi:hypothetical protein